MKRKITKIWGVGLIVVLLVSLLGLAAPASAGTLGLSAEGIPSTTNSVLADIDLQEIAVGNDGTTMWAVAESTTLYMSTDAGVTWSTKTHSALTLNYNLVAIAPDNNDIVAVASTGGAGVVVTTNGGTSWSSLGTVQESGGTAALYLNDLAISPISGSTNYVAVSGNQTAGVQNMWHFNVGAAAPVWTETNDKIGFNSTSILAAYETTGQVAAIAFSPNFASDKVLTALVHEDTTDNVSWQIYSFSHAKWNTAASFANYPDTVFADTGDAGLYGVTAADITLSPTYLGSDDTEMVGFFAFTGLDSTANDGIWRMKNVTQKIIKTSIKGNSVDYDGTNLVGGAYDTNIVYTCADPLATTPTVGSARSLKRPGLDTSGTTENTTVAWAGADVVAVTSGANGAFATSNDNGKTFNDISLIDAVITGDITDTAVSDDGSVIYMVSDDGTHVSLWKKDSAWARVLTFASASDFIVRLAPGNSDVVYVGQKGSTGVYYSSDGGEDKWFSRTCNVAIQDLAVESADTVYALRAASAAVAKSTNAGFTWASAKTAKVTTGYSLLSAAEGTVVVGGTAGYAAWSTDSGATFTKSGLLHSGSDNVVLAADSDFASNSYIYGASCQTGQNVERVDISSATAWTDIYSGTITGSVVGLAAQGGALYALELDQSTSQSALLQCTAPTTAGSTTAWGRKITSTTTDSTDTIVWLGRDSQNSPNALKSSAGSNKLWVPKTNATNKLYSMVDTLAGVGPTLLGPVDGFSNAVNTVTGKANEVSFSWSRLSTSTSYNLYIAYDSAFKESVTTHAKASTSATVAVPVGPDRSTTALVNWVAGETYYWRVKTTLPIYSAYSETRTLVIEPGAALVASILSPANGGSGVSDTPSFSWSPVSGSTAYQFVLADNPGMRDPIAQPVVESTAYAVVSALDKGKTYYWRVKAMSPVEGNWSTVSNFTVKGEAAAPPPPPPPPVVITQVPAPTIVMPAQPAAPPDIIIPPAPAPPAPIAPAYIWAIIIIGAVLMIAVVVLIFRTRRQV